MTVTMTLARLNLTHLFAGLGVVALSVPSLPAQAQWFTYSGPYQGRGALTGTNGNKAVVDAAGTLHMVAEENGHIFYRTSSNGVAISPPVSIGAVAGAGSPAIAIDRSGNLAVIFEADAAATCPTLYYVYRAAGASTWSSPLAYARGLEPSMVGGSNATTRTLFVACDGTTQQQRGVHYGEFSTTAPAAWTHVSPNAIADYPESACAPVRERWSKPSIGVVTLNQPWGLFDRVFTGWGRYIDLSSPSCQQTGGTLTNDPVAAPHQLAVYLGDYTFESPGEGFPFGYGRHVFQSPTAPARTELISSSLAVDANENGLLVYSADFGGERGAWFGVALPDGWGVLSHSPLTPHPSIVDVAASPAAPETFRFAYNPELQWGSPYSVVFRADLTFQRRFLWLSNLQLTVSPQSAWGGREAQALYWTRANCEYYNLMDRFVSGAGYRVQLSRTCW
jgi:hypothetical protein